MSVKQQGGFTLIEVLVATLVLTVGILGVAAMQMVSFQTNQSAYARSVAVYLAQDMFDRMRGNPDGYRTTSAYNDVDTGDTGTVPGALTCSTATNGCTPLQMAQQDVREWAANFYNVFSVGDYRPSLPNGRGVLERNGSTNEFIVTISWDEREWNTDSNLTREMTTRSVSIRSTLN